MKARRAIGWSALVLVALALSAALAGIVYLRSGSGRKAVERRALAELDGRLDGTVSIGQLDGDLWHGFSAHDVVLRDGEGREVARAAEVTAHYPVRALWGHHLDLTDLTVHDLDVKLHWQAGHFNVEELLKKSASAAEGGAPWTVRVATAQLDGKIDYDNPPRRGERPLVAPFALRGSGSFDGDGWQVDVAAATLHEAENVPTAVSAHGRLSQRGTEWRIGHGTASVATTGAAINEWDRRAAWDPADRFRFVGKVVATVTADGPLSNLSTEVDVSPAAGKLVARGTVGITTGDHPSVDWQGSAEASDLDPGAAIADAPHGRLAFALTGRGRNTRGELTVSRSELRAPGLRLESSGQVSLRGFGHAQIDLDASDENEWADWLGLPRGAASLKGKVERTSTEISATWRGRVPAWSAEGQLQLRIGRRHLQLAVDGTRAGQKIGLTLDGTPHFSAGSEWPSGATLNVDRLAVTLPRPALSLVAPPGATVEWIGSRVQIAGLQIGTGEQSLAVAGSYDVDENKVDLAIEGTALDAQAIGPLLWPGGSVVWPRTQLTLHAHALGHWPDPEVDLQLDGNLPLPATATEESPTAQLALAGHYRQQRLAGNLSVKSASIGTAQLQVDSPAPWLRTVGDSHVTLTLSEISVEAFARWLPKKLALLHGRVDAKLDANGRWPAPELDAQVDARWQLASTASAHTNVTARYHDGRASLDETTQLGAGGGVVTGHAEAPLALTELAHADPWPRLRDTPIAAQVSWKQIDLKTLDLAGKGIDLPLTEGHVDFSARLGGTLAAPQLSATLDARQLIRPGLFDQLDLHAELATDPARSQANATVNLHGVQLLTLSLQSPAALATLLRESSRGPTPLSGTLAVPRFDLATLSKLGLAATQLDKIAGSLHATLQLTGWWARPAVALDGAIDNLQIAGVSFSTFTVDGKKDERGLTGHFVAQQTKGGAIDAEAHRNQGQPISGQLRVDHFDLAPLAGILPEIRRMQGTLDGQLALSGTWPRMNPRGTLRLTGGAVTLAEDGHTYDRGTFTLTFDQERIALSDFALHSGSGWLRASGTGQLDGVMPSRFDINGNARDFQLAFGSFGASLDTALTIHGERHGKQLVAQVQVHTSTVNMPKLSSGSQLQSTDPLKDIYYTDAEARAAAAEALDPPTHAEVALDLPGPIHLRSKEVNADLHGSMHLALDGPTLSATGVLQTDIGWVELLSNRYQLERIRVAFDGPLDDPGIDFRVTRQLTDAEIIIEVRGTAKKPVLTFASDPPIYDASQILGIIISGDPDNQRTSDKSLDSKVVGSISGLVIGQIKDKIAPSLPIDVVKIDTAGDDYGGLDQTRVEVGKYITENIYVAYVHQFGPPPGLTLTNSNEADVRYRFRRRYELDTSYGDEGIGGIDLFWTYRY